MKYCKRQSFSIERRNDQGLHYIFTGRNLHSPYVIYKFASITIPIDDQLFTYNKKNPLKQKTCFPKKYFRQLNALSQKSFIAKFPTNAIVTAKQETPFC